MFEPIRLIVIADGFPTKGTIPPDVLPAGMLLVAGVAAMKTHESTLVQKP